MSYLNAIPLDLLIKCFLDYFPATEIITEQAVTSLFSRKTWIAIWKRDISTFNIPRKISYNVYKTLYNKYSDIQTLWGLEIMEMIKQNYNKLLDLTINKLTGGRGDFNIDGLFFHLSESNNIKFIEYVLEKTSKFNYHARLLDGAAMFGHKKVIEWLINNYPQHLNYNSALCFATRGHHKDIMQWMMDLGANDYNNAFGEACENHDKELREWMFKLIQENYTKEEQLQSYNDNMRSAGLGGDVEVVKLLLNLGATDYDAIIQEPGCAREIGQFVLEYKKQKISRNRY